MPDFLFLEQSLVNKQKNRGRRKKRLLAALAAILVVFGVLAFSPLLEIRSISFRGHQAVSAQALLAFSESYQTKNLIFIFSRANLIFFQKRNFERSLANAFPRLKNIKTRANLWARSVVVTLEERAPALIWCRVAGVAAGEALAQDEECFYADQEGVVYDYAPTTQGALILKVLVTSAPIELGDKVADASLFEYILDIKKTFLEQVEVAVQGVSFRGEDLVFQTGQGWFLLSSPNLEPLRAANILRSLFEQELTGEKRKVLEYIDLRVPDRLYYKLGG